MNESARTARSTGQSPTSDSIEALEEIVRNCQRNEERLHDLERHTRHERKKAERLLHETSRTIHDRDSRNISILEQTTINDNNRSDHQKTKYRPAKEFYVSLDDENKNHHRRQTSNNNKSLNQDKHLLERVEKLLAGDGTTTSSDVMSSQERQKKVIEKPTSPVEDDLDEKSLNINQTNYLSESRQIPSACSVEYDLSTVDRLLSERTPISNHRMKSDIHLNEENHTKKLSDNKDEKNFSPDKRDEQFYERLNNYVQTGRFVSPDQEKQTTTKFDETYQYQSRPTTTTLDTRDDELTDLARRCEDLLARLHTQRNRAVMLENSSHKYDYYRRETSPKSSSYESKQQHHHHHRSQSPSTSYESKQQQYHRHHHHDRSQSPSTSYESKQQQYHRHHHHDRSQSPIPSSAPPPMSLQQALELLRPEFLSRSRQRARRIRLLREEREHNSEIDRERREMLLFSCTNCCTNPTKRTVSAPSSSRRNVSYIVPYDRSDRSRIPLTYRQIKQETKKKYEQLPEVHDRRRQNQMEEIRRRNLFRAKVFRARLRQHVVRHGRTNIDESLTMIDT
jgi:hypothetical protein